MHPHHVGPPRPAAALALFCLAVPGLLSAQQGRLSGKITDKDSGKPLDAAQVLVVGTTLLETSNAEGIYTFRNIAPGRYAVRVIRISYSAQVDSITVGAGETAALNFALTAAPIQLDEIVSTATGQQRKLEVGNVVSKIDAASVTKEAPITEIGNIISGRVAGVQVLKSGGTTGTGTRIRIRGSNSLSLSNEPLYYIDGVRMESSSSGLSLDIGGGIGGGATSRINDLNPDDIESIEIVKGPAAATLYGIQAANGVVRITTKKGNAGKAKWNASTEAGQVSDHNDYLQNFFPNFTVAANPDPSYSDFTCTLQDQFNGNCTINSITKYSPLTNPETRPLKPGFRQQQNISVSGGTDAANYYLGAGYESEDGVFRLPKMEEDSIRQFNGEVPDNQIRPNSLRKLSVRANVGANVSKTADIQANLAYVSSRTRLIENDNSFLTLTGSAEASANTPDINRGWFFTPAQLFAELAEQNIGRFTGGLTTNWRPRTWLTTRATVGYDATSASDNNFFPTGQVADYSNNLAGVLRLNKANISQTSIDLASTATYKFSTALGAKTSVGAQWFRNLVRGTLVTGQGLAPGQDNLSGVTTFARDTSYESRTAGIFAEEELAYKERLYLTGALRLDGGSSFGSNFKKAVYPKTSLSWLTSNEPFWHLSWLNTFRLRAALGASGQIPGATDGLKSYAGIQGVKNGQGLSGVLLSNNGNPDLKPERSTEFEAGFDAGLAHDRVTVEFTYYTKTTKDALVAAELPGSLGSSQFQFRNLAKVRNHGLELAISAVPIQTPNFSMDFTLSGSLTKNKVLSLGSDSAASLVFGFYQQDRAGYPAGGFWGLPLLGYSDANHDGIIDQSEVRVGDTLVYQGSPLPTREAALNTGFNFFHDRIRLASQWDYRGGNTVDNSMENFRCSAVFNCRGEFDKTAPLEEQAKAQAVLLYGGNQFAFFEPGWFIKLREVSLTFYATPRMAKVFGASNLSLTLAARNLLTITDYSGVDPEVNAFGQDNFSSSDFESQPQVRYLIARVNASF